MAANQSEPRVENPQDDLAEEDPNSNDLSRVIDRLGFGCGQLSQIFVSGGMWMGDAAEVMILSSITKAMSKDYPMSPYQQSLIVSIVFVGVLLGNFVAGKFGDHSGRRPPILASMLGMAAFNILTLFADGFISLAIIRFFIGVSWGFGQPPQVALSAEISPSDKREDAICGTQVLFGLGELYSAFLVWQQDPQMQQLDWKLLVVYISIPPVIFFFACLAFLYESPRALALQGRDEEAREVLARMRTCNGRPDVSIEFQPIPNERQNDMIGRWWSTMKIIFGPQLAFTTVACCVSCFTINVTYIGTFYAFPLMLPEMHLGGAPAVTLINAALFDCLGIAIAFVFGKLWPRRLACVVFTFGQILSLVGFLWFTKQLKEASGDKRTNEMMLQVSMNGIKLFTTTVFCLVFVLYAEVFPTVARATGFGTTMTFGRLGAIVAPPLFEAVRDKVSTDAFFYLVMVAIVCNFGLFAGLHETKDLKLEDVFKDEGTAEQMPISAARSSSSS